MFELPVEPEVDLERVNERLEELPDIEEIVQVEEVSIIDVVTELFVPDRDECDDEANECEAQFEAEVVAALEIVVAQVTDVVQLGSIPEAAEDEYYDEEDAEELTSFDFVAFMAEVGGAGQVDLDSASSFSAENFEL